MNVRMSLTGSRWACTRSFKKVTKDPSFGIITDVKVTRVGFLMWHIDFSVDVKN